MEEALGLPSDRILNNNNNNMSRRFFTSFSHLNFTFSKIPLIVFNSMILFQLIIFLFFVYVYPVVICKFFLRLFV